MPFGLATVNMQNLSEVAKIYCKVEPLTEIN